MTSKLSNQSLPAMGFLRLPQVLELFPVSRSTWWAGVRDGRFPKAVRLSERCTAWKASDIAELIESKSQREQNEEGTAC